MCLLGVSGLGLLTGIFCQCLTEFSACQKFVCLFQDSNLSKYQRFFTKFDLCIAIMEIWLGIANGQFCF